MPFTRSLLNLGAPCEASRQKDKFILGNRRGLTREIIRNMTEHKWCVPLLNFEVMNTVRGFGSQPFLALQLLSGSNEIVTSARLSVFQQDVNLLKNSAG